MTTKREHAINYAIAGWPVFPCEGKQALITAWQDKASTNPDQIEEWWGQWPDANIGFVPGDLNMMVIDLDPGADQAALEQALDMPTTHLRAKTPRGDHLYFEIGEEEKVGPSAGKLAPHVDVRAHNSYVLLPGSSTADGEYEWAEEGKPAFRSADMLRKAGKQREKASEVRIIDGDMPEHVAMAITWLEKVAKEAIEGQGGDQNTYDAACMMHSYGIEESTALELMFEHYNKKCKPQWEYDDLSVKVANAYQFRTSAFGNVTSAYRQAKNAEIFATVHEKGSGYWHNKKAELYDWDGMEQIEQPDWLIEDMIKEQGYTMLFAPPDTWKTFVALDMAMSVATDFDDPNQVFPYKKDAPVDVVYCAGEGKPGLIERTRAWAKLHGGPPRRFHLMSPVPPSQEGKDVVEHWLNLIKDAGIDPKLIVFDTVARSTQGANTSGDDVATAVTGMVQQFQDAFKCAVLAIHHTGHDHSAEKPRGSSAFIGDVDVLLHVERVVTEKDDDRFLKMTQVKNKDGERWSPRFIRMEELPVGGFKRDGRTPKTTLVAMPATRDDLPVKVTERDLHRERTEMVISSKAIQYLTEQPAKVWSTRALAERIAFDEDVELSADRVRKYITQMANTSEHECRDYFNPDTRQWVGRAT